MDNCVFLVVSYSKLMQFTLCAGLWSWTHNWIYFIILHIQINAIEFSKFINKDCSRLISPFRFDFWRHEFTFCLCIQFPEQTHASWAGCVLPFFSRSSVDPSTSNLSVQHPTGKKCGHVSEGLTYKLTHDSASLNLLVDKKIHESNFWCNYS